MPFARPDFGFNDYMSFEQGDEAFSALNGWKKFMDCFSLVPKYERVKNYIEFIHEKKMEKLRLSIPDSALRKFRSENKGPGGKTNTKFANLELLRQVELNRKLLPPREQVSIEPPTKDEVHVLGLKEEINNMARDLDVQKDFVRRIQKQADISLNEHNEGIKSILLGAKNKGLSTMLS